MQRDEGTRPKGIPLTDSQTHLESLVLDKPWTVTLYTEEAGGGTPRIKECWWMADAETANAVYTTFKIYIRGGKTHELYSARHRTATVFRVSSEQPLLEMALQGTNDGTPTRGQAGASICNHKDLV